MFLTRLESITYSTSASSILEIISGGGGGCYDSSFPLLFSLAFVLHFLLMPFLHTTITISFHFSHDDHPDYESLSFIPLPSDGQPRFLCSDNFRYLLHTTYHIELPLTFRYYIAWSVHSSFRYINPAVDTLYSLS